MKTAVILLLVAGAVALVQGQRKIVPISQHFQADSRIIEGNLAANGQFPHHAFLVNKRRDGSRVPCGGSLISPEWVLTAAQCLANILDVYVHLGHIFYGASPIIQTVDRTIFIHHLFNPNNHNYDVGLVKLNRPVTLTDNIKTIPFAKDPAIFNGVIATLTGFGGTTDTGTLATRLSYADLRVVRNAECEEFFENGFVVRQTMCAVGVKSEAQGICTGDSGSPLIAQVNGVTTQIGIAIFRTDEGCITDVPNLFARTEFFADWIKTITGL